MESAKIGIEWKVSKEKVGKLASRSEMSYVTEEHEEARVFYGLSYAAHLTLKSSYIPALVSVRNTLVTPSRPFKYHSQSSSLSRPEQPSSTPEDRAA